MAQGTTATTTTTVRTMPNNTWSSEEVKHIPITINQDTNLYEGATNVLAVIRPTWKFNNIVFKLLTEGITNILISCRQEDDVTENDIVLVRIYGEKTDMLIDRNAEKRNILLLQKVGIAPALYATFNNGMAYQYVHGRTLSPSTVVEPKIYKLVAALMGQLHRVKNSDSTDQCTPALWTKIDHFLKNVPERFHSKEIQERFEKQLKSKASILSEIEYLKSQIHNDNIPIVFSHNDLLLGNVIYDEKVNRVRFIDFEYAGYNYQPFDIGNHFSEFVGIDPSTIDYSKYPNEEFQCDWIREYLISYNNTENVSDEEVHQLYVNVNKFTLASHLFWLVWSLVQTEYSTIDFDYLSYGFLRFNVYHEQKKKFLNLK